MSSHRFARTAIQRVHSAKSLVPTQKKNSFNKYLSLPPRCAIHDDTRYSQSTYSEPEFHPTAWQELHYKQSMRSILKSSKQGTSNTPRSNSKRRKKRSTRICSAATFSSKGEDKDKDTSLTLRNHQKTHSPTREPRECDLGRGRKRPDKAAATWKRHQIVQWTILGTVEVIGSADERDRC
jgi:hypothetical protein